MLGELDWMVRQSVELEVAMLSVERLLAYADLPGENVEMRVGDFDDDPADSAIDASSIPPNWPMTGGNSTLWRFFAL